jgi:hypothetical protein
MPLRNNRFWVFIIIILLLLSFDNLQALDWKKNWYKPPIEFLGATTGDFLIGTLIVIGSAQAAYDLEDIANDMLIGYIVGGSVGAPTGTILTAKIVHDEGSVLGAYVGGIVGTGLGMLSAIYFADRDISASIALPTFLLFPPLCSVIGCKLHKPANESHSSIPKNFPVVGLTVLPEKYDNKISPKIGANVMFRF